MTRDDFGKKLGFLTLKQITSISALALSIILPATAVQAEDWTGFYAGASGGYSFGAVEAGSIENESKKGVDASVAAAFGDADPSGFEASVFIGYRMQSGGLVYGLEGGISGGSVEGSGTSDFSETSSIMFEESYYLRGILGTEYQGALVYGSLGLVSTSVTTEETDFNTRTEGDITGLTIGVGYERMLTETWGIRAEINHTIYEDDYAIRLSPPTDEFTPADFSNTSVQLGVTYRF